MNRTRDRILAENNMNPKARLIVYKLIEATSPCKHYHSMYYTCNLGDKCGFKHFKDLKNKPVSIELQKQHIDAVLKKNMIQAIKEVDPQ